MEPIAIVGLSCRFPGADCPSAFWRLLCDGVDAIREVPPARWDVDAYYDADPDAPGKMASRWGGFVDDVDRSPLGAAKLISAASGSGPSSSSRVAENPRSAKHAKAASRLSAGRSAFRLRYRTGRSSTTPPYCPGPC